MISRAIALAVAVVTAGYAQAQTIVARSGEHGEFTRLVMRIPDGVDWSLTQSEEMATVNVASPTVRFNTRNVFDLIPRNRIVDVRQDAPGQPLRIDLGCECRVDYYQQANGFLVIDVREGTPDIIAQDPNDARQDARQSAIGALPLTFPTARGGLPLNLGQPNFAGARVARDLAKAVDSTLGTSSQDRSTGPVTLPIDLRDTAENGTLGAAEAEQRRADAEAAEIKKNADGKSLPTNATSDASLLMDFEENRRQAMVNDSEQRLLQQIGRASEQGLLTPDDMAEGSGMLDPLGNEDRPLDPLDNVSVTSAIDRETGLMAQRYGEQSDAAHCLPNRELAIHRWGAEEESFAEQLGALRNSVLGEFDQVNTSAALKLARLYLHFGFGAEAQMTLAMIPPDQVKEQTREIINTMADILDSQDVPVHTVFSGQQACKGDAAFWAALSDGAVKKSADTDAIQQAFARLPAHLRILLGPRMTTFFAEAGDSHVAKAAMRSVDRTGIEHVPDRNLAEAAIAEMEGDHEAVAQNLTEEVAALSENAPIALIELVDLSFQERKALSPDVPDLAASYEFESRDTPLGQKLRRTEVIALALTSRFEEAFEHFDELQEQDGRTAATDVIEPLMTLLSENADDVTFLKYALIFADTAGVTRAGIVGDVVARRLLDLGFAEQAETLLGKMELGPENDARRLMNAEALLAMDEPQQALVELMGIEGDQADRMRAQALWRNKEYERASAYMMSSQDLNSAARGYWHSEDLIAAESLDEADAPFRAVADLTSQIETASQAPEGLMPLAEARALVESSIGARDSIEQLLQRVERTPPSDE